MKKRLYTIIGFIVGITLAWLVLIYVPHHRAQIELSAESAKARRRLSDYSATMARLDDFVKTHENLLQLRDELEIERCVARAQNEAEIKQLSEQYEELLTSHKKLLEDKSRAEDLVLTLNDQLT